MTHSKQSRARGLLILFVVAICITADRLSKTWALTHLAHGEPQPFIPGFVRFTLTTNPGAAFSIGSQNGQIMAVVATVLSLLIGAWIVKRALSSAPLPVVEQIGMGCLLGGALGNLIDRYTRGLVTDFLEFTFMPFPIFNVADVLIDVGIGCLFIAMYVIKDENSKAKDTIKTPSESDSSSSEGAELKGSTNCSSVDPNCISRGNNDGTANHKDDGTESTSSATTGTINNATNGSTNQQTKHSD